MATTDRRAAWAFAQGEAAYCPAAWELIRGEHRDASGSGRRGPLRRDEVPGRPKGLRNARRCPARNRERRGEERLGGERLDFRVRQVPQPDAWVAGQRRLVERLARQGASESELQAAALIRAVRSRAMVSAVARQQVVLARPEPSRERQAQQPDEPASAPERRVSQRPEQREREPA